MQLTAHWTQTTNAVAGRPQQKYFLSLLAPLKDEDPYLVEFVNYYLIQGVDHFYFYDNDSRVPVVDVIAEYRDKCTVMRAPGDAVQGRAMRIFARISDIKPNGWPYSTSTSSCCRTSTIR